MRADLCASQPSCPRPHTATTIYNSYVRPRLRLPRPRLRPPGLPYILFSDSCTCLTYPFPRSSSSPPTHSTVARFLPIVNALACDATRARLPQYTAIQAQTGSAAFDIPPKYILEIR